MQKQRKNERHTVALQELRELEAAEKAPVGEKGHRPLDVIQQELSLAIEKWARAHFYKAALYSLSE